MSQLPSYDLHFGRAQLSDFEFSSRREWLCTNSLGGYAMGTLAGHRTRVYHGYLIAPSQPPVSRRLLLAKVDEKVSYGGREASLRVDEWGPGEPDLEGLRYMHAFCLEGTVPVWNYQIGDAVLQKRVWLEPAKNTTHIAYRLLEGKQDFSIWLSPLGTFRDHHEISREPLVRLEVSECPNGLSISSGPEGLSWYILSQKAEISRRLQWRHGYHLSSEAYRGLPDQEDLLELGLYRFDLKTGEEVSLVCTTSPETSLDSTEALKARQSYEDELWRIGRECGQMQDSPVMYRLCLAADQFIVNRPFTGGSAGRSVIAGYPWFGDWGRDTMISIPGLTIATGRFEIAREILQTFAAHVDQGMLPNRFPDEGENPEYNTVDATLWFFEAVGAYLQRSPERIGQEFRSRNLPSSANLELLEELFPALQDIIEWHFGGTRFGIGVDPVDELLRAGESGVQLTWMDAKVDEWVVTPRIGKPVEINALWYNALRWMESFTELLGRDGSRYRDSAEKVADNFARFWNARTHCLYDVIDGPGGNDPTIRPNQLVAIALPFSPLTPEEGALVLAVCERELLTSRGLRSLTADHPEYIKTYGGDRKTRDSAYHQGTVWGWLTGIYLDAFLRVRSDRAGAKAVLECMLENLQEHGIGSLSEIFDGDPPHVSRGCPAQAWTVAEVLRVCHLLTRDDED